MKKELRQQLASFGRQLEQAIFDANEIDPWDKPAAHAARLREVEVVQKAISEFAAAVRPLTSPNLPVGVGPIGSEVLREVDMPPTQTQISDYALGDEEARHGRR